MKKPKTVLFGGRSRKMVSRRRFEWTPNFRGQSAINESSCIHVGFSLLLKSTTFVWGRWVVFGYGTIARVETSTVINCLLLYNYNNTRTRRNAGWRTDIHYNNSNRPKKKKCIIQTINRAYRNCCRVRTRGLKSPEVYKENTSSYIEN